MHKHALGKPAHHGFALLPSFQNITLAIDIGLGRIVFKSFGHGNSSELDGLTVLVNTRNLNQAATALDRIWCIYEVYLTHSLEKPFTLNFKLGPLVGVVQETKEKDSWVFHIFKMLQHIDVQQADATNPDDYRKIMGEIANFQSRDGRSGPQALNRIVKAMLGSQAIFTLARRGDMGAVRRALELDADPNIPDTLGIRPLTYAAGNGHDEVVQTLIAGKADVRAQRGANEVLAMFSPNRAERRRCIDFVRALDEAETGGVHSQAISRALLQHTTSRCQDLTSALDADNAELRLEVVRELRSLLHALVDHRNKLMRDQEEDPAARDPEDPASGEDERIAIGRHARSLAPYMADPDPRVRIAVVEAVTSIKAFDLSCLKVPKRMIQEDDLHIVINSSEKLNVVHLAAMQPYPNALYMLATGVDWALEPKALRALDGLGRNIAHLAVKSGHLECLAMMVGEQKLPRSSLMLKDSEGRTPVHYAALNGDSGSLRAFVDLASLTPGELCPGWNLKRFP
ncbi:ift122 [Symbiodinium sp. CCMP2592]|nr:ift122 [Symbiodinium sp. CCMP2592]